MPQIQIYKLTYKSKRFTLNKIKGICPMLGEAGRLRGWRLMTVYGGASSRVRQRSSSTVFHLHFCTFLMEKLDLSILREGILTGCSNCVRKLFFTLCPLFAYLDIMY